MVSERVGKGSHELFINVQSIRRESVTASNNRMKRVA